MKNVGKISPDVLVDLKPLARKALAGGRRPPGGPTDGPTVPPYEGHRKLRQNIRLYITRTGNRSFLKLNQAMNRYNQHRNPGCFALDVGRLKQIVLRTSYPDLDEAEALAKFFGKQKEAYLEGVPADVLIASGDAARMAVVHIGKPRPWTPR